MSGDTDIAMMASEPELRLFSANFSAAASKAVQKLVSPYVAHGVLEEMLSRWITPDAARGQCETDIAERRP